MIFNNKVVSYAAAVVVASIPAIGSAATYTANLTELNNSGVSGSVLFDVDEVNSLLNVSARISGLTSSSAHVNHIHGRFNDDGTARNSEVPTPDADTDGDGFVEVLEGAPAYGDILLSLEPALAGMNGDPSMVHTGPVSDADGNLAYDLSFDLSDDSIFFSPVLGNSYTTEDIFPLDLREYVIHGLFVPGGVNGDLPEGGYLATLPVAAAELEMSDIAPIPLPAGGLLLIGGLGAFGVARRFRKA